MLSKDLQLYHVRCCSWWWVYVYVTKDFMPVIDIIHATKTKQEPQLCWWL